MIFYRLQGARTLLFKGLHVYYNYVMKNIFTIL